MPKTTENLIYQATTFEKKDGTNVIVHALFEVDGAPTPGSDKLLLHINYLGAKWDIEFWMKNGAEVAPVGAGSRNDWPEPTVFFDGMTSPNEDLLHIEGQVVPHMLAMIRGRREQLTTLQQMAREGDIVRHGVLRQGFYVKLCNGKKGFFDLACRVQFVLQRTEASACNWPGLVPSNFNPFGIIPEDSDWGI